MAVFQTFFSGTIGQENVFYEIVEPKNAFLGYKNKNFKNVEKLSFFERVGFDPKMAIFPTFFSGNIG